MSKENALNFLSEAAKDKELKAQLQEAGLTRDEIVKAGNKAGYTFNREHLDEALTEVRKEPGFWGSLGEAIMELFSPAHDDYPSVGVQPYSGDTEQK